MQLSHLLFADNLLIMIEALERNVKVIQDCLHDFQEITNQKVNTAKLELFLPDWIEPRLASQLSARLGLSVAKMPFVYLGVPISRRRVSVKEHGWLVEQVARKLDGWKRNYLPQAGRLTLLNAVLLAIPTYWLGCLWVPNTTLEAINRVARGFL
ncbi:uncharacterized protein [Typha latifolia]|uniref:uncharacterized protein n=1 Tax=Typha latifolia TaxID=4733 RepID=UPI003C2DCDD6